MKLKKGLSGSNLAVSQENADCRQVLQPAATQPATSARRCGSSSLLTRRQLRIHAGDGICIRVAAWIVWYPAGKLALGEQYIQLYVL